MRLDQIQKRTLITESWNDPRLTLLETQHIIPFVSSIEKYITEAQLTPDQISQLFTNVEQGATAAGGNRTMLGKGKDAASFISKKIDELGAQLKKAGPVDNMDAKFKELKTKIGSKDSKVVSAIQGVSDWAKENPGKASIAVAILTAAAAMSGGIMAGAVAGFLARATKDLLQGADLSTAVGKAVKTGALGALVGLGVEGLGDAIEGAANVVKDTFNPNYVTATWDYMETVNGVPGDWADARLVGFPDDVAPAREAWDKAIEALRADDYETFENEWKVIQDTVEKFNSEEYQAELEGTPEARKEWADGIAAFAKMADGVAAAAQGAAQASDNKKESTNFNPIQIETIIEWCDETPAVILTEGPMDAIKKGAAAVGGAVKKGASAVGAKAAKVGKNMTTKITADKLNSAWKKAGSPTDSDAIANILRQQGVSDEVLAPVYKQMGAKLPAAPAADAGTSGQTGGTTTAPAKGQSAAAPMDFKGIQQAVAKLSQQDAKALVTHIDSLNKTSAPTSKQPAATPNAAAQPAQAAAAPNAKAAAPQGQAPADAAKAAPATNKNAAAGDTYEKAKGDIRKVQGGQKPMPPKTAATIASDLAKLAKGDKESGVAAAQKIMNFAKAGVDVSKQQQAWIANSKAGERFLTQSEYFELSKMMREHNLSWSDLGIRVHLLEGTNKLFGISVK
jgi:hypothetical protein